MSKTIRIRINCKKEKIKTMLLNPFRFFNDIIERKDKNNVIIKIKEIKKEYRFYIDADYDRIIYIRGGKR
ncbi:MAG: hypothetical protein QXV69_01330 [Sulfolobaceae archaeon]